MCDELDLKKIELYTLAKNSSIMEILKRSKFRDFVEIFKTFDKLRTIFEQTCTSLAGYIWTNFDLISNNTYV